MRGHDTLCELCSKSTPYTQTTDQVFYCPNCQTYTCTHLSLESADGERCNECETELEGQYWLVDHPLLHEGDDYGG